VEFCSCDGFFRFFVFFVPVVPWAHTNSSRGSVRAPA
jgi:hypothetical protein